MSDQSDQSDRCELCGARWQPGADACRECGVARPKPPPITAQPMHEDPEPWVSAAVVPPQGATRKRWLVAGGAAVASLVLGGWLLSGGIGSDADVASECPKLQRLAGSWSFTTEVTGARALDKLDLQGFYTLEVELDGCLATARMTKLGFTGQDFSEARTQRAQAQLQESPEPFSFGHGATFELRDASDRGPDQHFVFDVEGERIVGVWRQRGARWSKAGLYGFLEGVRAEPGASRAPTPTELRLDAQPCDVRCILACDALRRDDALGPNVQSTCDGACRASGGRTVACGDRRPLPEPLVSRLSGPAATLEVLCEGLACRLDPKLGKRRAPVIAPKSIDAGRMEAHLLEASRDGAPSTLRLALYTQTGWFLSEPLIERGDRDAPSVVTDARLHERSIGRGAGHRSILGTLRSGTTAGATAFVCRPDDGTPSCVVVPGDFELRDGVQVARITPLGDDTLALASADDELVLLFGW